MSFDSYGVIEAENILEDTYSIEREDLIRKGFTIVKSGYLDEELDNIKTAVFGLKREYYQCFDESYLRGINEHNTLRSPLLFDPAFLDICLNDKIISVVKTVMGENFILNQQNVIINPSKQSYNQLFWHRDLPYQHFVSSRALSVNALFCVDDFTAENGSTHVLPFSHKNEIFPSDTYLKENSLQIEAKKGDFILIDSMLYHSGGFNFSDEDRIGVNNVFSTPMIRRQIDFKEEDFEYDLKKTSYKDFSVLGLNFSSCRSVFEYLKSRVK